MCFPHSLSPMRAQPQRVDHWENPFLLNKKAQPETPFHSGEEDLEGEVGDGSDPITLLHARMNNN